VDKIERGIMKKLLFLQIILVTFAIECSVEKKPIKKVITGIPAQGARPINEASLKDQAIELLKRLKSLYEGYFVIKNNDQFFVVPFKKDLYVTRLTKPIEQDKNAEPNIANDNDREITIIDMTGEGFSSPTIALFIKVMDWISTLSKLQRDPIKKILFLKYFAKLYSKLPPMFVLDLKKILDDFGVDEKLVKQLLEQSGLLLQNLLHLHVSSFEILDPTLVHSLLVQYPITSLAWKPDGTNIITGSSNMMANIWDLSTYKIVATLKGHTEKISSVAWSSAGNYVAAASFDNTVLLSNIAKKKVDTLQGNSGAIYSITFSPDEKYLATGSEDNTIQIWNTARAKLFLNLKQDSSVYSVAWSPDGKSLAAGHGDGTIKIWNATSWDKNRILHGHSKKVIALAWSPDGKKLLSGSEDNTAKLWDVTTAQPLHSWSDYEKPVRCVAWIAYGEMFVTASGSVATIRDATTMKPLNTIAGTSTIVSAEWGTDDTTIAIASDTKVALWKLFDYQGWWKLLENAIKKQEKTKTTEPQK